MKEIDFRELFQKIGCEIKDENLLKQALTHKSRIANDPQKGSNERLEFLGDSVLGFVISKYLFQTFPSEPEGKLSKLKSVIVSEPSLAHVARKLELGKYILVNQNEESYNLTSKDSVLSDAFEALIAAVYLSLGMETVRKFILDSLSELIDDSPNLVILRDSKTILQELSQEKYKVSPEYEIVSAEGLSHDMTFVANVKIDGKVAGSGIGKSKKAAQQAAAKEALDNINKG